MKPCLICESPIDAFLSFGKMPLGNGFLLPEQFHEEYFFDLAVGFCNRCGMVQLLGQPERERMFHEQYAFFSGTSAYMARHFRAFAEGVRKTLAGADPFVVEIGSNDGIMLRNFAQVGIRHLGVEPSENVARAAMEGGVRTVVEFFGVDLARRIVSEHGQADAFLAANVMCHIPYLQEIVEGIRILLKPDGIVVFEEPYLGDVIDKTSYDQIYDEHTFLFSVTSLDHLFGRYGMEIVDAARQETHGGSMRYSVACKGARPVSGAVFRQREKERALGLSDPETYVRFRKKCESSRDHLLGLLQKLKRDGKRVVGYGATSKSTTVINYCGITSELVEFISDTTPIKQGKYTPGAHIPVHPYEEFRKRYPDYALLFAWNHAKEIMEKEGNFRDSGGKWIVYVPEVKVLK